MLDNSKHDSRVNILLKGVKQCVIKSLVKYKLLSNQINYELAQVLQNWRSDTSRLDGQTGFHHALANVLKMF